MLAVLSSRRCGGITGYAVGTGGIFSSACCRGAPFENRLRTLLPVRSSTERVDRPATEGRFASVGRRRKSVRVEKSSEAIGLDIPSTAPEEER